MIADPEKYRERREMPDPLQLPRPIEVPAR